MKTLFVIKLPSVKVRKALAGATKVVRPKKGGGYRRSASKLSAHAHWASRDTRYWG
jgi:hypothetical protein